MKHAAFDFVRGESETTLVQDDFARAGGNPVRFRSEFA
jgi:hypothetical protein